MWFFKHIKIGIHAKDELSSFNIDQVISFLVHQAKKISLSVHAKSSVQARAQGNMNQPLPDVGFERVGLKNLGQWKLSRRELVAKYDFLNT